MKLSVSILNSENKKEMVKILNNTDISYIHIDVMDGKFVSQKTLPYQELIDISKETNKKLDVHLMMEDPEEYIDNIKEIKNIDTITIHLEINKDIKQILTKIKKLGIKRGLSIKPNTKIESLIPFLEDIDLILIMTVEPGLGGQPFLEESTTRIKQIKDLVKDKNILLEVDGGINNNTIDKVKEADIAVVGSYITKSDDPINQIKSLLV